MQQSSTVQVNRFREDRHSYKHNLNVNGRYVCTTRTLEEALALTWAFLPSTPVSVTNFDVERGNSYETYTIRPKPKTVEVAEEANPSVIPHAVESTTASEDFPF